MSFKDIEYGYSLLLSKQLDDANMVFCKISEYDIRADWAIKLISILKNEPLKDYPSYLQVRNFLELDLNLFIEKSLFSYVEKILDKGAYFYEICRESYKFLGRALYYNKKTDLALKYFLIAKDNFYKDAELHYLLGKLYADTGDKENSKHSLKTCLELLPDYEPAVKLLEIL